MLPMFPLQIVVFPREEVHLHIFEPRYKQLIAECEKQNNPFGIAAYMKGQVMEIGTRVYLRSIEKRYPKGEMDIIVDGDDLFQINVFYQRVPNRLYAGAEVEPFSWNSDGDVVTAAKLLERLRSFFDKIEIERELPEDPNDLFAYDFGHQVGFSLEQKYQFLCIPDETERQQLLLRQIDHLLPAVEQMEEIRRKAQMNGHFKNLIPPDLG